MATLKTCNARTRNGEHCRNKAVDDKGFCRSHHPDASTRPTTGSDFEDKTLKVLRLLGYRVERNVSLNGCQIDILAEYRTGIIPLRLMVECKDYSGRTVGVEEVNKFAGVLHAARPNVDKGLLVTTHGFTNDAKRFALSAGIELVTFASLSTQLVNLDDYIQRVLSDFERSPVFPTYIDLSGSVREDYEISDDSVSRRPLTELVDKFLADNTRSKLALLGNFGTGKTTFCQKYAHDLANKYRANQISRIPLVIPLSDFESKLDIQELVVNTLQFRYGIRIDIVQCEELQRLGKFALILDGFDEMAARVDPDMIRDNIREINKLARIPENKLILTCRTHFFRDRIQADILADFDVLYIPEWGEEELEKYLYKCFGSAWEQELRKIHDTHNLRELAQTPLFLEMIVETLPTLGDEVRRIELYRAYTDKWIKQQSGRRGARLNSDERMRFVTELAAKLYIEDRSSCHYTDFITILRQRFEINDAAQMDYLQSDVRNCTFLTRDAAGYYGFRHKSFMEFFIAEMLASQIRNECLDLLSTKLLTLEISHFLADILKANPPSLLLIKWLEITEQEVVRQNLLSLVARLKIDVSNTKLEQDYSKDSETKLAARFIQGDTKAFDEIYHQYQGQLSRYVRRRIGDNFISAAEDIMADVFLNLWLHRDRLENINALRPYLFAIASNRCIDFLRKNYRAAYEVQPEDIDGYVYEPPRGANQIDATLTLTELLNQLPESERSFIKKMYIDENTLEDIALESKISITEASRLKRRAIQRLRSLLKSARKEMD